MIAEVTDAVLFLASGHSAYVTGSELLVDGGPTSIYLNRISTGQRHWLGE